MKKDEKVEFLRIKNKEKLKIMLEEKGKYEILSYFSNFFDRRTYFKMDDLGNITTKNYNPILILFAFCSENEKLAEYIFKYSFPEEKQNLKKIDRSSNLTIPTLRLNLIKTLQSSNLNFSKIFAKELYLRSQKDFFEVLYTFCLMGNPENIKLFFVYALEKIFNEYQYDDNILYITIAYLTKIKDEYSTYMNSSNEDLGIEIKKLNEDKKIYLKIFNEITNKYNFKNKYKFINSLNKHFEKGFVLNTDIKEIFLEK